MLLFGVLLPDYLLCVCCVCVRCVCVVCALCVCVVCILLWVLQAFVSLFLALSSSLQGFCPSCIKISFTSVCSNTFFFYFRFLKSYLRNFGVAPDSAALMVIERGIQTELKCSST